MRLTRSIPKLVVTGRLRTSMPGTTDNQPVSGESGVGEGREVGGGSEGVGIGGRGVGVDVVIKESATLQAPKNKDKNNKRTVSLFIP